MSESITSTKLNPLLFNEDQSLKPEVKDKILDIVKVFLEYLQVDINVSDIRLVGSNASYNYNVNSDLDVHILTDVSAISDPEIIARLYFDAAKKNFKDSYDIKIKGIDVELYVEDVKTSSVSNGVYSVTKDKWVKTPVVIEEPTEDVKKEARKIEKDIVASIKKASNIEELTKVVDDLYLMRKDALSTEGEMSAGNLAFKALRNKGILDKVKNTLHSDQAKELSLEGKEVRESTEEYDIEPCSQKDRKELYHISPSANKESVLSKGLKSPVYLTWDYKTMLEEDPEFISRGEKFSLFIVDTTSLNLRKDPEWDVGKDGPWEGYDEVLGYICDEDIEPSRIRYVGEVSVTSGSHPYSRNVKVPAEDKGLKESIRRAFACRLKEDRKTLKTLKGSAIKRSKYGVGKEIGGQIYFHKNYIKDIPPAEKIYDEAVKILQEKYPKFKWKCLMYDKKKPNTLRFDEAPDFDTAREPIPGVMYTVNVDTGEVKERASVQIWHHKWMWVKDDYTGFNVDKSYEWSMTWLQKITSPSGKKSKWEQELRDAGLK